MNGILNVVLQIFCFEGLPGQVEVGIHDFETSPHSLLLLSCEPLLDRSPIAQPLVNPIRERDEILILLLQSGDHTILDPQHLIVFESVLVLDHLLLARPTFQLDLPTFSLAAIQELSVEMLLAHFIGRDILECSA